MSNDKDKTIQQKGGEATLKKHGTAHYKKMAAARWGGKNKKKKPIKKLQGKRN